MILRDWLIGALGGHTHAEYVQQMRECVAIGRFEAERESFARALELQSALERIRQSLGEDEAAAAASLRAGLH
jgi:hypothetical protein